MKKFVSTAVLGASAAMAAFALSAPANAASAGDQVAMCSGALVAQGLASPTDRARLLKTRGGAVKTVTLRLVDLTGSSKTASCKIQRGEVLEAKIIG